MDTWHPRAISAPANLDGLTMLSVPPKVVLHTTETSGPYVYVPSGYYGNCVTPETLVLCSDLAWRPAGDLVVGDELVGFAEEPNGRAGRAWVPNVVEVNRPIKKPCVRIITSRGDLVASTSHPWLSKRNGYSRWKESSELVAGDELVWFSEPWAVDQSREGGWLAGMLDGEGSLHYGVHPYGGTYALQFAQKPGLVLDAFVAGCERRGIKLRGKASTDGTQHIVIAGGRIEVARVLGSLRPMRLLAHKNVADMWHRGRVGHTTGGRVATVLAVEPVGEREVAGLQTSARTYIAGGVLCHNSYWPHATIDAVGIHQHLPIDVGAYALAHAYAPETNRANAIQCEIVWRAEQAKDMPDDLLANVGDWVTWVCEQTGAPLAVCPQGFHGSAEGMVLASEGSPIRFAPDAWLAFSGVCGHQHIGGGNDHWDPGAFPWDRMLALAGGGDDLTDDDRKLLQHVSDVADDVQRKLDSADGGSSPGGVAHKEVMDRLAAIEAEVKDLQRVGGGAVNVDVLADVLASKLAARLAS